MAENNIFMCTITNRRQNKEYLGFRVLTFYSIIYLYNPLSKLWYILIFLGIVPVELSQTLKCNVGKHRPTRNVTGIFSELNRVLT